MSTIIFFLKKNSSPGVPPLHPIPGECACPLPVFLRGAHLHFLGAEVQALMRLVDDIDPQKML